MQEGKEVQVINKDIQVSGDIPVMDKLLMAVQNGMSVETLEKFMDLAERNQKREAENAFHKAFAAFKANPPQIVKDHLVDFTNKAGIRTRYMHATIGNVVSAIIEGMSKHGLSHNWSISQNGGDILVTCKITHELGHSESTTLSAGADQSGGKNAIQAIASTVTYLERYTLQAATGIAVLEEDDDGAGAGDVKEPAGKTTNNQANKQQSNQEDRTNIDKWLEYVDKHTHTSFDVFQVACDQYIDPAIAGMKNKDHANELKIAKNEMVKFLQEKK